MKKNIRQIVLVSIFVLVLLVSLSSIMALDDSARVSVSLVNQEPDPASAGDIVELRVGVQNIGDDGISNLQLEFVPSYPFSLVSGESATQEINYLEAYQGYEDSASLKILKFKVRVDKDATAGSYELQMKYKITTSSDYVLRKLSVDIDNRDNAEIIQIDKTILVPGQQTTLKFKINNVGNSPLRDITFSWSNEDDAVLPVGSDNTRYISYIDINEDQDVEYQVIANTNADPGLYKLNLRLSYYDSSTQSTKNVSTIAGIYIGGETDFDITFSESTNSEYSFNIANIGSNPAYSVSVIVPEQTSWKTTGANSMIIGNLNTGDYTVASFTLQTIQSLPQRISSTNGASNSNLENILFMNIAYTDTTGTRHIVEKNITMQSTSNGNLTAMPTGMPGSRTRQTTNWIQYVLYGVIGLIFVVLIIIYLKYKKEKKYNPNYKFNDLFKKKEVLNAKRK